MNWVVRCFLVRPLRATIVNWILFRVFPYSWNSAPCSVGFVVVVVVVVIYYDWLCCVLRKTRTNNTYQQQPQWRRRRITNQQCTRKVDCFSSTALLLSKLGAAAQFQYARRISIQWTFPRNNKKQQLWKKLERKPHIRTEHMNRLIEIRCKSQLIHSSG